MEEKQLIKELYKKNGSDFQHVVAMEELAELQKEISKSTRLGYESDGLAEEVADDSATSVIIQPEKDVHDIICCT